jgi:hypothetical protein
MYRTYNVIEELEKLAKGRRTTIDVQRIAVSALFLAKYAFAARERECDRECKAYNAKVKRTTRRKRAAGDAVDFLERLYRLEDPRV